MQSETEEDFAPSASAASHCSHSHTRHCLVWTATRQNHRVSPLASANALVRHRSTAGECKQQIIS